MTTLQVAILKRALGDKGFESLHEQYVAARHRGKVLTPPSASQMRLASLYKKVGRAEAAKQAGVDATKVDFAVSRVSRWNFLNK